MHGSIRPAAYLVTENTTTDLTALLSDFSESRFLTKKENGKKPTNWPNEPRYASPERLILQQAYSTAMDIYSFGLTLINFLTYGSVDPFVDWELESDKRVILIFSTRKKKKKFIKNLSKPNQPQLFFFFFFNKKENGKKRNLSSQYTSPHFIKVFFFFFFLNFFL